MIFRSVVFIFSSLLPIYSYSQLKRNDTAETISKQAAAIFSQKIEVPPPQVFKSKFRSLNEWLTVVINGNQPLKPISKYNIGLFEAPSAYTLSLIGVNTSTEGINMQLTRIDYTPREMYFDLPENYYQNLTHQELLAKIVAELKNFAASPAFKNSFLAVADNIVLETNGEVIWKKK